MMPTGAFHFANWSCRSALKFGFVRPKFYAYSHAYLLFWKHNLKMRLYSDGFVQDSPLAYLIMVSKWGGIFLEAIRIHLWFIHFRIFLEMYLVLKGGFRVFSPFSHSFLLIVVTLTGATRASMFQHLLYAHCYAKNFIYISYLILMT